MTRKGIKRNIIANREGDLTLLHNHTQTQTLKIGLQLSVARDAERDLNHQRNVEEGGQGVDHLSRKTPGDSVADIIRTEKLTIALIMQRQSV